MEDDNAREATYWLFEQLAETEDLRNWDGLGVVVQAYLNDSLDDLKRLRALAERRGTPITVRLVKGAYWDAEIIQAQQEGWPVPVYLNKADTDANYERLTRYLLDHIEWLRPAFASHNARSIAVAIAEAEARQIPAGDLEFQMLYGMAEGLMETVSNLGYRLRIYTPVGEMLPGMAYLVRRLLENTSNEGWLVQAGVSSSAQCSQTRSSMAVMPARLRASRASPSSVRRRHTRPSPTSPCSTRTASQARRAGTQRFKRSKVGYRSRSRPAFPVSLNPAKRKGGPAKIRTKATNCSPEWRAPASGRRNAPWRTRSAPLGFGRMNPYRYERSACSTSPTSCGGGATKRRR